MSLESMVAAAEKSLGLTGRPNYITKDYAAREGAEYADAPWCDMGVTYWARQSGEFAAVCLGHDYAYTVAHAQAFKDHGQWHPGTAGIRRGDVVFMNWDAPSTDIAAIDHVGICTGTSGAYTLTVEANTLNSVARRVRAASVIVGYGRPHYSTPAGSLPAVSVADVQQAFRQDGPAAQGHTTYPAQVLLIERALHAKGLLAAQWVDGSAGTRTRAAYSTLQLSYGYHGTSPGQAADGIPGMASLQRLATESGTFRVVR